MATLTINGRQVKVDDSFLSLPPDQQNKTVDEIAAQLGSTPAAGQTATPPAGLTPGSREYADWAAAQARAGNKLPQAGPMPPANPQASPTASPNLLNSTAATLQGITGSIPFLNQAGDALTAGAQSLAQGNLGNFGQNYGALQQQRQQISQAAPIADTLGGMAGMTGLTAGIGLIPGGLAAMGMEGNFGQQLGRSIGSMGAYEGLQGLSKGHTGGQLLTDELAGMGGGALGSVVGQGISGLGDLVSKKVTQAAQNRLIDTAAVGSGDLANNARGLFQSSVDDNPIQITSDAYHQLLSNVGNALQKFRPNSDSNQPVTGILQKLYGIADDLNTPGSNIAVDLKDLHIFRQQASEIAQQGGQNGAMGSIIVNKIDNFIKGLKPGDVAGGADPAQAATDLMQGISDWAKAQKVNVIQDAVARADTLKSDPADNLKTAFSQLMRSSDFGRYSPAEQAAIRQIAKGTSFQNAASFLGKLGVNSFGGPTHIVGGGFGTGAVTAALSPFLGPAVAFPVALGATAATGAIGRSLATDAANQSVSRAIRAVTAGDVPLAATAPNILAPFGAAANVGIRAGITPAAKAIQSIIPALAGG